TGISVFVCLSVGGLAPNCPAILQQPAHVSDMLQIFCFSPSCLTPSPLSLPPAPGLSPNVLLSHSPPFFPCGFLSVVRLQGMWEGEFAACRGVLPVRGVVTFLWVFADFIIFIIGRLPPWQSH
ncbi:hypothetical protein GOODEAATRI_006661, partial [Goodea atripinnis]